MYQFYYLHLNAYERAIYKELEKAISALQPEIKIDNLHIPLKRLEEISRMVLLDHAEYYWSKGDFDVMIAARSAIIRYSYFFPAQECEEIDRIIFSKIEEIGLGQMNSLREQIMEVCAWIYSNVKYDQDVTAVENKKNQTIYSVFVEGKSLCMGIAKSVELLMRLCGNDSMVVLGNLFGDQRIGHSWNMVRLNGEYLQVDVTMGFPQFRGLWKDCYGEDTKECVLVPYYAISRSHRINPLFPYPI